MEFSYICVSKILHFNHILITFVLLVIIVKTCDSAHIPEREFQPGNQTVWTEYQRETIPQQNEGTFISYQRERIPKQNEGTFIPHRRERIPQQHEGTFIPYQRERIPKQNEGTFLPHRRERIPQQHEGTFIPYQRERIQNLKERTVIPEETLNQNDFKSERVDRNTMETKPLSRQSTITQNGESNFGQESTTMIRNKPYYEQTEYPTSEGRVRNQHLNLGQRSRTGTIEEYINPRNLGQEIQMRNFEQQHIEQQHMRNSEPFNSNFEGTYASPNIQNQKEARNNIQNQRERTSDYNINSKIQTGRFESTDMISYEHKPMRESGSVEGFPEQSTYPLRQGHLPLFNSNSGNNEPGRNGHGPSLRKEASSQSRQFSPDKSRLQYMRPHSTSQQSEFSPYRKDSGPTNMLHGERLVNAGIDHRYPHHGGRFQLKQEGFIPTRMTNGQRESIQSEDHYKQRPMSKNSNVPLQHLHGQSTESQSENFYQPMYKNSKQFQVPRRSLYEHVPEPNQQPYQEGSELGRRISQPKQSQNSERIRSQESTAEGIQPYNNRNEKRIRPEIHDHVDTWHDHLDTVKDIRQDQMEASLMFGHQNLNLHPDIHPGHINVSEKLIPSIPYTADKWADHVDTLHDLKQDQMEAAMYLQHVRSNNQNVPHHDTKGTVSTSQQNTNSSHTGLKQSKPSYEIQEGTKQQPNDLLTSSSDVPWEGVNYAQGQRPMARQESGPTFKERTWDSGNHNDNARFRPKLSYWEATSDLHTGNHYNTRSRSNTKSRSDLSISDHGNVSSTSTTESNTSYSKVPNNFNSTRLDSSRKINNSMDIRKVDNSELPPPVVDDQTRNRNQNFHLKPSRETTHHRQSYDGYQSEYPIQPAEGIVQNRHGEQGSYHSQRTRNQGEMTASKRDFPRYYNKDQGPIPQTRPVIPYRKQFQSYPEYNQENINQEGVYLQEGQGRSRMTNWNSRSEGQESTGPYRERSFQGHQRQVQENTGTHQKRSFQGHQGQVRESTYPYHESLYQGQSSFYDPFRPRYYNQPDRERQMYNNGAEGTNVRHNSAYRNEGTEKRKNSNKQEKGEQESESEGSENKETTSKRPSTQDYEPEDRSTTSKPDNKMFNREHGQSRFNYESLPEGQHISRDRPVNRFRERWDRMVNLGQGNTQNEGTLNGQIGPIQRSLFEGTGNSQNQHNHYNNNRNTVANQHANTDPYRSTSFSDQTNPQGHTDNAHQSNDRRFTHQSNDRRFKVQNSQTSTMSRSNGRDQNVERSKMPSSGHGLKQFGILESTTSTSVYKGSSVLHSNNAGLVMNSGNNGTVKSLNDTSNGLKIEPVTPPSTAAGAATFGVIIGLSVAFLVILAPFICLVCRFKKKRDAKKKRLQTSYGKNIEDTGIVEAMIMSDLGKGIDLNEYKSDGATGGHVTKYNEYSSYVNDKEETKYLKSHSEPVIHHAIVH